MSSSKTQILSNICYSELVYGRINKKLEISYNNQEIEALIYNAVCEADESSFEKIGKNIYVSNVEKNIRITINSNNYRVITVDKI